MPTLAQYRRHAAPWLGVYRQATATSGSTTSVLEDTSTGFKSSIAQDDLFADCYLFRPSAAAAADKIRRVTPTGYSPSAGTATVDLIWTNNPYAAGTGETYEIHGLIPPIGDGSGTFDLHFLINEALKRCLLVHEFTFSPASATAKRHSLATAAAWLDDPQYVYGVAVLGPNDTRADIADPYASQAVTGQPVKDTNVVYLTGFSAQTTDTVYVLCAKPAYYAIQAGGSGAYTQSGLSLEGDVGIPALEWVTAATLVEVWSRIGHLLTPSTGQTVAQAQRAAADRFSRLSDVHFQEPLRTFDQQSLLHFGPIGGVYAPGAAVYDANRMYG